ncbi:MAG: glycosyltransferase [Flavobacterium sp.]|nr:glycosyltransferase [Flavobacterium sp.]
MKVIKKPKVLFLIPSVDAGGIETYLLRFIRFAQHELDIAVLVRNSARGDLYEQYAALGIDMHFMPLGYYNPKNWLRYYQFFKAHEFDVVCDFNANFAGLPLMLANWAGIQKRLVFYRQGRDHFDTGSLPKRLYSKAMNRLVYRNATGILSNSQANIDYFFADKHSGDPRFHVIYNGVDAKVYSDISIDRIQLRKQLGIPTQAYVVGHSGRLDPTKNHNTILDVATELIRRDPDYYFVFCGMNTERLQAEIDRRGISNNVKALGFRTDVPLLLKSFDLFYFPSLTEGQPNALIEALLAGLPFVASDIAPIREILPENLKQYLVSPLDKTAAIKLIDQLRTSSTYDTASTRDWATSFFSPVVRFEEFLNQIRND